MKKGEMRPRRIEVLEKAIKTLRTKNADHYALIIDSHEEKIRKLKQGIVRDKEKKLKLNTIIDAEYYCHEVDCPAREVKVWQKFYDAINLRVFDAKKLPCPICGKKLTVHYEKEV